MELSNQGGEGNLHSRGQQAGREKDRLYEKKRDLGWKGKGENLTLTLQKKGTKRKENPGRGQLE